MNLPADAFDTVASWLRELQTLWCTELEAVDGGAAFRRDRWQREEGGGGDTAILAEGAVFERAGVGLSVISGATLPPAASRQRPELAGRPWRAAGVSAVLHPRNPYVPTAHCNVRFFTAGAPGQDPLWWFGGGFDLTPYYGFEEDAAAWHRAARAACAPFGDGVYPRLKRACDDYFRLPHRGEPRGIGGLFFDDWTEGGFERSFGLAQSVGEHFLRAYLPIVGRRKGLASGAREREFQLYRRGRYVEFNLVHDRGTLFGLQSGGRTESILMSLPPVAAWRYDWKPSPGSPEAELYEKFLKPRDWI